MYGLNNIRHALLPNHVNELCWANIDKEELKWILCLVKMLDRVVTDSHIANKINNSVAHLFVEQIVLNMVCCGSVATNLVIEFFGLIEIGQVLQRAHSMIQV